MNKAITRFAPSPNGLLHVGHAFSALFSARLAQDLGGTFLLRIEDIDTTRTRREFVRGIFDDLQWLGLRWPRPVRFQSRHMDAYCKALKTLHGMGLLYPCTCTRKRLRETVSHLAGHSADPDGAPLYPGLCRPRDEKGHTGQTPCRHHGIEPGKPLPPAWRLDMDKALALASRKLGGDIAWRELGHGPGGETGTIHADPARWGDVILGRRDIGVSYHVAVVIDDALQGVTHVTRGQDLFHATAIHRLLQVLLELPQPAYVHHRLITDAEGRKLSKSLNNAVPATAGLPATTLKALREAGMTAAQLRALLGFATER